MHSPHIKAYSLANSSKVSNTQDIPSYLTWLVSVKYILAQKDKSSELRNKLDCLRDRITADLVEIRSEHGLVSVPMIW